MIRLFDFIFSLFGILVLWPFGLIVYVLGLLDTGSPVFKQQRVGKNKKPFTLLKFRTMSVNTKSVATHLASSSSVTKLGAFLRKSKLDELPQLINVLRGDMSLVGPRPNLFNQEELIKEREERGVYNSLPGITGLAQINEIDMSTPKKLAEVDAEMLSSLTIKKYFQYILATVGGKGSGDRIKE
ncbi:Sugar transferase involved in LPS biosynthesis (colanic, teichoic acid) [Tenacibaculum sp. MAR_2009_124]|uniref:sugar transferase n=1 Tax=Tenacibaculum sp. MAR_2009_124 TaxID=1250059 RepID=UPI0008970AF5|nr:sugar transferase [Tenacibaculum sp. MAR_2009_124]SEB69857.1 Sugar transferase involved in LPS biosynthesis (colanic, teichoic acid) [Tenacibaculum sp. MAR_2009_124]